MSHTTMEEAKKALEESLAHLPEEIRKKKKSKAVLEKNDLAIDIEKETKTDE